MDDDFDFDFFNPDYTDILSDDVDQTAIDPSKSVGSGNVDWASLFKNFGGAAKDFAGIAKGFLNPKGDLGGLPLLALAALGNKAGFFNAPTTRVGFQGTIPQYTFERQQTPIAQQRPTMTGPDGKIIPYRPGQGGISYFTPSRFVPYVPPTSDGSNDTTGGGSSDDKTTVKNAAGGYMPGGIAMLARGRYLKGNGDGVSDSIPARFADSGQEARLADGEFVIPARVVAEIGNGSSDAGARKLYAMLDRVEAQAKKAKRGKPSGADRELKKLA
jgi:hypothetical protein